MRTFFYLTAFLCSTVLSAQISWTEIGIPVRDGQNLAADLYGNDTTVAKPVILIQTPYNKNFYRVRAQLPPQAGNPLPLDTNAFHYVILDWRGFFGSRDAASQGYDRGLDGYDAVEWIAAQSWCNGKVGTWGPSALGAIQFQTARHQPPHLVCAVPLVKDFKTQYTTYYYGGEFRKSHVGALQGLGFTSTALILDHPTNDIFIRVIENRTDYPEEFAVPMLMIGGWFDHYPDHVIRGFHDIVERSDPNVRDQHRFIYGPWTHSGIDEAEQGELEYPNAVNVGRDAVLQFFYYHLLNAKNGWPLTPRVRYYQLGENEWRETDNWYTQVATADTTSLYLQDGNALSVEEMEGAQILIDEVTYDPRDPSPTHGGSFFDPFNRDAAVGPFDQREVVESRDDALLYTTEPLTSDLEVTGPVAVELYVATNRYDTDVAVRLCDVYPDGRSMILTQGIRRLRFRDGFRPQDTALGEPGTVYKMVVELQNLAVTFKAGHRLRIIVTGSNYPHFDVNPNTPAPLYNSPDSVSADIQVYAGTQIPSRIILPIRTTTGVADREVTNRTSVLSLSPNPLLGNGTIHAQVSAPGHMIMTLCDAAGNEVLRLADRTVEAGEHTFPIMLDNQVASGAYFCRLSLNGKHIESKPIVVVR